MTTIPNDCIRNTTEVCNHRQNSVRDKIQSEKRSEKKFFWQKKNIVRKKLSPTLSWI